MADGGVERGTVGVAVGGDGDRGGGRSRKGWLQVHGSEEGARNWTLAREELTSVSSGFSGKGVISLGGGKGAPLRGQCGLR